MHQSPIAMGMTATDPLVAHEAAFIAAMVAAAVAGVVVGIAALRRRQEQAAGSVATPPILEWGIVAAMLLSFLSWWWADTLREAAVEPGRSASPAAVAPPPGSVLAPVPAWLPSPQDGIYAAALVPADVQAP